MTEIPALSLEERVTLLEEKLAYPPAPYLALEIDEAEAARWCDELERAAEKYGTRLKVLPRVPLLTPESARALLRECVTVVKPGEVLAVRVPDTWTARQVRECSKYFDVVTADRGLGITVLFMSADEFAVMKASGEA